MFELNTGILAILLLGLGLGFVGLTVLLLRVVPRLQPLNQIRTEPPPTLDLPSHNEAVLVIQSGGRVSYLNEQARELFNLWDEDPNLERMARQARPSEAFLSLCASDGQASFSLNGRFVEGTSYYAPDSLGRAILVTLHRPQWNIAGKPSSPTSTNFDKSSQAFNLLTELSQAISANLDLEATLQAILEGVERLMPFDVSEINIWDAENRFLVPYRLIGMTGETRRLEKSAQRYRVGDGYSGYLIQLQKPLLIGDVDTFRERQPAVDRQQIPFSSYLGIPLITAGDFIGTLELASLSKENFSQNDLEVLKVIAGQAAVAVHNALLYEAEQQRALELASLANLAQAVSSLREPHDLYTHLTESLSPLLQVEFLGFLVYDENRRTLEGQSPFVGLQSNVIEWYQTTIQPDSPADEVWLSLQPILTADAPNDPRLEALGLHHLAQAAGMRHTALLPLTSGGRMLGYLQAANKRDGSPFDQDDLRLLMIIAGQAAPIIENSTLVEQSRRRAQRAETLRRIASLTSSSATLDEILQYSILDLARLLQADVAAIYLLDENRGELRLHKGSLFGISPENSKFLIRMPVDDPGFPATATSSQNQFTSGNLLDQEIPPLYLPLAETLKIRSIIVVPLVVRERGIGEIILGSMRLDFFKHGDILSAATAAGQLAAAIEKFSLYSQTDQSLRQRVDQMTAVTRISREINSTLDLESVLQRVYDEALRITHADCGSIILFSLDVPGPAPHILFRLGDHSPNNLSIQEQQVFQDGDTLIVEHSEGSVSHIGAEAPEVTNEPIISGAPERVEGIASIVRPEVAPDWMPAPPHGGIQSALIVPIAYQGEVAGLIHLHGKEKNHFDGEAREIIETLAVQAAIALGNAYRYQEQVQRSEQLNRRVETLAKLFEISQIMQKDLPLEQSLEAISYAIQEATPFEVVLISVYDDQTNVLQRVTNAGIPLTAMEELRAHPQSWSSIQKVLEPKFRLGNAYFIPFEQLPVVPVDVHTITLLPLASSPIDQNSWDPEDMLLLPLISANGQPLGMISVDAPRDNLRPDRPTLETLEIFSSQAALAIENYLKLHRLKTQVNHYQQELTIAQQAAEDAANQLPALLDKGLEQRAGRIGAGLDIAEVMNRQSSQADLLVILGKEILGRMDLEVALIAEAGPSGPRLLHTLGNLPPGTNPEALLGQRNPLRFCLQSGEMILVSDLDENVDWQNAPILSALEAKAFICLPIALQLQESGVSPAPGLLEHSPGIKTAAQFALLATSRQRLAPFTAEDEQLYILLSRQAAIALQNLNLLNESRRRLREVNLLLEFSRQLGSLDPASILRTLVDSALQVLPSAQAGMVALWDAKLRCLVPQAASGYINNSRLLEIFFQSGEGLPGQVFETNKAIRLTEVDLARHYNLASENLLRYRDATAGRPPVCSMCLPIGRAITGTSEPLGILLLDNFKLPDAFTTDDQALIASLTQQTALTLENAGLYQASEQRARQLQTLTNVATAVTSSLKIDALIATLLDQLQEILPYQTGTLWLREDKGPVMRPASHTTTGSLSKTGALSQTGMLRQTGAHQTGALRQPELPARGSSQRMVVRAARGFADSDQRVGLSVAVEDSKLLNEMTQTGCPLRVANVKYDPRFTSLIDYQNLSWLGVPLIASGEVIGVFALEKAEEDFYTTEHIQVAMTFASQAAIGMENASLFQESLRRAQELDQRSQRLAMLNRLSDELSGSLDATRILEFAAQELFHAIRCSSATAILFGPGDVPVLQAEYPPSAPQPPYLLPDAPLFEHLRQTLGIFNSENVEREVELQPLADFLAQRQTRSLLAIPLSTTVDASHDNRLHGLLLAHNRHTYRFDPDEVELARTISNQVAIAVQNARLFDETRSLTEDLEQRVVERTAELAREHQRTETLLRIITELSSSLDLDQVLNRTLHVLNEMIDAEQITVLIARPGEKKLHRLASVGYSSPVSNGGSPTPFALDQGLAGWVISQRESALIPDLLQDSRWVQIKDAPYPQHRSALAVPLMIGQEALGTLMLFHHTTDHFSLDQLDLVQASGNQVAVAVNNAELYRLIRDQAEDLGSMLRNQQIETSRSKAILEAVADGVLVTDANKTITLFNASAEKILNLKRTQVVGKSLEYFTGLFGRAAQSWRETISTWSLDPNTYQPGDTFAEQITLENGRVVAVRLAPVSMRKDFLGTVSIFQDITHQVEVDRLKSEFVATVSHELRTPMTSIKGYVEILLMGAAGEVSEQQKRFLEIVKTNTERLAVLVNDLLDISRIESGKVTLSLQPINLDELADQAIADLERHAQDQDNNKSITIKKEVPSDMPRILGDLDRVRQILDNLLDNAYLYNTENGSIVVRMHPLENEVQVDVKDNGIGIPLGEQPSIFERFFRGESPLLLGVSGTGLGLSIVQNLVQMHHGQIWLESSGIPGEGSTFSFTLPIYVPQEGL